MKEIEGQCFTCYDRSMYEYFGQTSEYNQETITQEYIKGLKEGLVVNCYSCGGKMQYRKTETGQWQGEFIKS